MNFKLIWECKEWKPIMKGFISTKLSLEIYLDEVKLFFKCTNFNYKGHQEDQVNKATFVLENGVPLKLLFKSFKGF